jgi:hypothetical protein
VKLIAEHRVDMETAEARALAALKKRELVPASYIAGFIWPDHSMKAQGAGAAASRILTRLADKGKARWKSRDGRWGWELT